MIKLDATARRYGVRPSTLMGVENPLAAAVFDQAVAEHVMRWEVEHKVGEFWYLGLFEVIARVFGGGEEV